MKKKTLAGAFVAAALLGGAANAATIGFEGLDAGAMQNVPLTTFTEAGFTFGLTWTGPSKGPAIFDTLCKGYKKCNDDKDLRPRNQGDNGVAGNVLILQDAGNGKPTPNDAAAAGTITFTLLDGPALLLSGASAVDDGIFGVVAGGKTLGSANIAKDRQTATIAFDPFQINRGESFTLTYSGSGGFDALQVAAVPLPAALPMLLAAMGGLGWAARRRKAA
ncbi:hypothetical protein OCGS_1179 [Oceaniovalibus guishaninsula JLT2003]|uniref:VPLPA-CTERM protein sorting domain-containing protein n=1 Tax=Oceaniovalibus guishaninsula JLT2003 TaxID=1231392 RepID=K2GQ52_9RHOB|nr:VPLPA-CTERM sorting domain-containing protein [Oceaniovalibus guishaninsula]EKE44796.1 hypothetical protein OCGS_1179 [Oceaniovalibus guishaninsula JLT2003]